MTTSQRRVLELAILGLEAERGKIDQELADIRSQLGRAPKASTEIAAPAGTAPVQRLAPNKGRKMSAAQKKKISQAMKARWAGLRRRAA